MIFYMFDSDLLLWLLHLFSHYCYADKLCFFDLCLAHFFFILVLLDDDYSIIHTDDERGSKGSIDSDGVEDPLVGDNSDQNLGTSSPIASHHFKSSSQLSEKPADNEGPDLRTRASSVSTEGSFPVVGSEREEYSVGLCSPYTPSDKNFALKSRTSSGCSLKTTLSPKSSQRSLISIEESPVGSVASVRTASPSVRQSPTKSVCSGRVGSSASSELQDQKELSPLKEVANSDSNVTPENQTQNEVSDHNTQTEAGNNHVTTRHA